MALLTTEQAQALMDAAKAAAAHCYAPYSGYPVGAALLTACGRILTGANVENASYGLTLCAERVVVASAVTQGFRHFTGIAVWAQQAPKGAVTPCGACRQSLAEFFDADAPVVHLDAQTGVLVQTPFSALFPQAFSLEARRAE